MSMSGRSSDRTVPELAELVDQALERELTELVSERLALPLDLP